MRNYRRVRILGAKYFFTVSLADRSSDFLVRNVAQSRAAFGTPRYELSFWCDAFVVLPNCLHAIWSSPPGDADYSTRLGAITARLTMRVNKTSRRSGFSPAPATSNLSVVTTGRFAELKPGLRQNKREATSWQRKFWKHRICDETDYRNHMAYCWSNPVKHEFVQHPTDWPYSSIHRDIRAGRVGP